MALALRASFAVRMRFPAHAVFAAEIPLASRKMQFIIPHARRGGKTDGTQNAECRINKASAVTAIAYLLIVCAMVATILLGWLVRGRRRQRTLTGIMDSADAMELLLHRTRERMVAVQNVIGRIPADIAAEARASLAREDHLQAAFRDLLQHRLWLQQNTAHASQRELDEAAAALDRARERIASELDRLEHAGAELDSATTPAMQAAKREPAALRRSNRDAGTSRS